MFKFANATFCTTAGTGYWSNAVRDVQVEGFKVAYVNDEADFGELRVYFNTNTWNIKELGLIYTDSKFMKQFKQLLVDKFAFTAKELNDLCYSEQGMQGSNYVSMDIMSANLITKFNELSTVVA